MLRSQDIPKVKEGRGLGTQNGGIFRNPKGGGGQLSAGDREVWQSLSHQAVIPRHDRGWVCCKRRWGLSWGSWAYWWRLKGASKGVRGLQRHNAMWLPPPLS